MLRTSREPPAPQLPLLTALSLPAGVGLHLRAQLLPLRLGHGPRAAAAQGEQEGRERRDPRQARLLHALLLRLSPRARRARVFLLPGWFSCSQKENACLLGFPLHIGIFSHQLGARSGVFSPGMFSE